MPLYCATVLTWFDGAKKFALERHAEAAAAPEHHRRRDDQPEEGEAQWLDMIHGSYSPPRKGKYSGNPLCSACFM